MITVDDIIESDMDFGGVDKQRRLSACGGDKNAR